MPSENSQPLPLAPVPNGTGGELKKSKRKRTNDTAAQGGIRPSPYTPIPMLMRIPIPEAPPQEGTPITTATATRQWSEDTPHTPHQTIWQQSLLEVPPQTPPSPSPNPEYNLPLNQMDLDPNKTIDTPAAPRDTQAIPFLPHLEQVTPPLREQGNPPPINDQYVTDNFETSLEARMATAATTGMILNGGLGPHHDPLDKYSLGPMPTVHIAYPTAVLKNIDHKIIEMWVKHQPEKLLTIPFDSEAKNKNNHSTIAGRIFAVVTEITKANDLSVATPEPSETAREKDQMPMAFLIYNLTSTQRKTLLDREVWSSASITFYVTLLNLICPDFLFAIKDLFTMDEEVRTLVQNVWHDAETETFALSLIESTPDDKKEKTAKAINTFILSLKVKCLNIRGSRNALKPQYNIYANGKALPNDIL
ncbi:hypothetical protein BC827DRAFT_1155035 [Russula dissimulans]|nr:hypothetical protein BC827DRAFT_1155035 [Russula dissimulans]